MFCESCGKELKDDARFCVHCGAPVKQEAPKAVSRVQPYPYMKEERRVLVERVKRGDGGLFIGWFRIWTNILFGLMTVGLFVLSCVLGHEEESFGLGLTFLLVGWFLLFGCYAFYMLILSGFENLKRMADNTAMMTEMMKRSEGEGAQPQPEQAG